MSMAHAFVSKNDLLGQYLLKIRAMEMLNAPQYRSNVPAFVKHLAARIAFNMNPTRASVSVKKTCKNGINQTIINAMHHPLLCHLLPQLPAQMQKWCNDTKHMAQDLTSITKGHQYKDIERVYKEGGTVDELYSTDHYYIPYREHRNTFCRLVESYPGRKNWKQIIGDLNAEYNTTYKYPKKGNMRDCRWDDYYKRNKNKTYFYDA